jgi:hypothetical protein
MTKRPLLPRPGYSILAFILAALLLFAGFERVAGDSSAFGRIGSGFLYAAYGVALLQGRPLAYAKHWWAAALPSVNVPLGILVLLLTIPITMAVRRGANRS